MRGPMMSPRLIASRSAMSLSARYVPTSRTVVKPDISVTRALSTDSKTICEAVFFSTLNGSAPRLFPSATWVWQSMNPGRTVFDERSMTFAFAGIASPLPTASILLSRTRITWSVNTLPASGSTRRPALMAVTCAEAHAHRVARTATRRNFTMVSPECQSAATADLPKPLFKSAANRRWNNCSPASRRTESLPAPYARDFSPRCTSSQMPRSSS